jgi:hypothetical protein
VWFWINCLLARSYWFIWTLIGSVSFRYKLLLFLYMLLLLRLFILFLCFVLQLLKYEWSSSLKQHRIVCCLELLREQFPQRRYFSSFLHKISDKQAINQTINKSIDRRVGVRAFRTRALRRSLGASSWRRNGCVAPRGNSRDARRNDWGWKRRRRRRRESASSSSCNSRRRR